MDETKDELRTGERLRGCIAKGLGFDDTVNELRVSEQRYDKLAILRLVNPPRHQLMQEIVHDVVKEVIHGKAEE